MTQMVERAAFPARYPLKEAIDSGSIFPEVSKVVSSWNLSYNFFLIARSFRLSRKGYLPDFGQNSVDKCCYVLAAKQSLLQQAKAQRGQPHTVQCSTELCNGKCCKESTGNSRDNGEPEKCINGKCCAHHLQCKPRPEKLGGNIPGDEYLVCCDIGQYCRYEYPKIQCKSRLH